MNSKAPDKPADPQGLPPVPEPIRSRVAGCIGRQRTLGALLLFQLVYVLLLADHQSLWLDEAYTARISAQSIRAIHDALAYDAGPPLYYDLLHIWRLFWGDSEPALRLFSLSGALIATGFLYRFCRSFFDELTAALACLCWIVLPLSVHYAFEARNYTLFAAETTAYVYFLFLFFKHQKRFHLDLATLAGVLLVYTHNLGWFTVGAGLAISGLLPVGRHHGRKLLVSCGVILLAYLPWVSTLLAQLENTHMTIAWTEHFRSPWAPLETLSAYLPGGATPSYLPLPKETVIAGSTALALGAALILALLKLRQEPERAWFYRVLGIFLLGLLGPYAYSQAESNIYLPGRTDFAWLPLFCLMAGYSIRRLPQPLRIAYPLLILACSIYVLGQKPEVSGRQELEMVRYLQRQARAGDIILTTGLTRPVLEYYLGEEFTYVSYPRDMAKHLAHINEAWYLKNLDLRVEAESLLQALAQRMTPETTLWVIGSRRPINAPLEQALQQSRELSLSPPIRTARMGLRVLDEPTDIRRVRRITALLPDQESVD
jgi:hypothetical protein